MSKIARLNFSEANARLHYDDETGEFRWKGTFGKRAIAGCAAGAVTSLGYVSIRINGRAYQAHRIAWLIKTRAWPIADIDHINGVRSDNRWCNIRQATRSQNCMNRPIPRNNTSGYKGVSFHRHSRKWYAHISGKCIGYFMTPEQASDAYERASSALFGEFKHHQNVGNP